MRPASSSAPSRAFAVAGPMSTAVLWMLAALACFAALDTTTKVVSRLAPVLLVVWFRFLFQGVLSTLLLVPRRRQLHTLRSRHEKLQWLRGVSLVGCSLFAILALQHLPLGEFTAILMLTPLSIALMAVRAQGERIGALRWALLFGGMAGALIILRPGSAMFGWAVLLPLAVVVCNTVYQLVTARLARREDSGITQCYTGWIGALVTSVALPWAWQSVSARAWALMALIGLLGSAGHLLLMQAYRRAPPGRLTPLLYGQIGFATLASWWVFDHTPDALAWLGLVMIAGCGAASALMPPHRA